MNGDDAHETVDMDINDAVSEVERIIEQFEDGDVTLNEAKELRERGEDLLKHIRSELDVGDGEIKRVN